MFECNDFGATSYSLTSSFSTLLESLANEVKCTLKVSLKPKVKNPGNVEDHFETKRDVGSK